eukprot:GEMP01010794.1.p1 GENE.GEMP01010794.1~~GEMP01010794.1.p1  ORF type:complete len:972 (+),score=199.81 GEMP01010794.1:126-3041(+)
MAPTNKEPDAAEIATLAETHQLYRSNLFRRQVEELLRESKIKTKGIEEILKTIPELFADIPTQEVVAPFKFEDGVFYNADAKDIKGFVFEKPAGFHMIGSLMLKTVTKWRRSVDLGVELPRTMFQSKDYLNYRYADKRQAYLLVLKKWLQGKWNGLVHLDYMHGDIYKPILALKPKDEHRWTIYVHTVIPEDLFPLDKLAPERNCLRCPFSENDKEERPSPCYNTTILEDAYALRFLNIQGTALDRWTNLGDAVVLLKRWTRNHCWGLCGPSGFALGLLACHAAQTTAHGAGGLQLMKMALSLLVNTPFAMKKLLFGKPMPVDREKGSADFGGNVSLWEGHLNVFWRCDPVELIHVAKHTLQALDNAAISSPFDDVFGTSVASCLAAEQHIVVDLPPAAFSAVWLKDEGSTSEAPEWLQRSTKMASVFARGLDSRLAYQTRRLVGNKLLLGLSFHSIGIDKTLEKGPEADNKTAAAEFRKLWGPKAQLRRFKDGSILECVAFEDSKPSLMEKIPASSTGQIIDHLCALHFPQASRWKGPTGLTTSAMEECTKLYRQYSEYKSAICALSGLPLSVKDLLVAGAGFSYTNNYPEFYSSTVRRHVHEVVLEFEASGVWPADKEAVRHLQLAFFLRMREELEEHGIEAHVSPDDGGYMDTLFPNYCFRTRIFHPNLCPMDITKSTMVLYKCPPEDVTRTLQRLWWRPRIRQRMHALALEQPSFPPTVKLCQKWMASQLMSGYDDFVEHLVAYLFLQPRPFSMQVGGKNMGFARFLWLLRHWDFELEPLCVPFTAYTEEDVQLARQSWERRKRPAIFSHTDPHGLFLEMPEDIALQWIQKRAANALTVFHNNLKEDLGPGSWAPIFALDMTSFDVVLRLRSHKKRDVSGVLDEAKRRLIKTMRTSLESLCLVCVDTDNDVVGLKWNPRAFLPNTNKVLGSVPYALGANGAAVPDVISLLGQVMALGTGVIDDVEIH